MFQWIFLHTADCDGKNIRPERILNYKIHILNRCSKVDGIVLRMPGVFRRNFQMTLWIVTKIWRLCSRSIRIMNRPNRSILFVSDDLIEESIVPASVRTLSVCRSSQWQILGIIFKYCCTEGVKILPPRKHMKWTHTIKKPFRTVLVCFHYAHYANLPPSIHVTIIKTRNKWTNSITHRSL